VVSCQTYTNTDTYKKGYRKCLALVLLHLETKENINPENHNNTKYCWLFVYLLLVVKNGWTAASQPASIAENDNDLSYDYNIQNIFH
jgi:hypothetical protein